jgi:starch synthase
MTVSSQPDFQKGLHVLMVAAECKGIVKVGGVADVVSDLSQTLNELGVHVSIIMPYYDAVEVSTRRTQIGFDVRFGAKKWQVKAYRKELNKVTVYLLKNSRFFGGDYGGVYIDSSKKGGGPFQDDAIRFAFFSASALELIRHLDQGEPITTLHCHDWQAGTLLFLLKHDLRYEGLAGKLRTLFTVHNLVPGAI